MKIKIIKVLVWGKHLLLRKNKFNSSNYWEERYKKGGNSGSGSYGNLALYKAEVLNEFVEDNNIKDVIEFGCGDGNQLRYYSFPKYIGFDVSDTAIEKCELFFSFDNAKKFKNINDYNFEKAELTISVEVLFHLIEDNIYNEYMNRLFDSSLKYVIIFSSNKNDNSTPIHVKHRVFTEWVIENKPSFKLIKIIKNKYGIENDPNYSFSDFYIFKKFSN
ncbi:class I SAM-dependent methyltransferase [Echinicola shivajiensis]|uniref:class I SAM-dependent methyltransferase n=1 Tax=Echinicola shivajiensis TaxID=1035916 RepID=UPI001BFC9229|nr:class I SAM-dependent methyltransferase [Echinicola shivajiensis]